MGRLYQQSSRLPTGKLDHMAVLISAETTYTGPLCRMVRLFTTPSLHWMQIALLNDRAWLACSSVQRLGLDPRSNRHYATEPHQTTSAGAESTSSNSRQTQAHFQLYARLDRKQNSLTRTDKLGHAIEPQHKLLLQSTITFMNSKYSMVS